MFRTVKVASHTIANKAGVSAAAAATKQLSSTAIVAARSRQIANHFSSSSSSSTSAPSTQQQPNKSIHLQFPSKMPSYGVRKIGAPNTLEYRVYTEVDGKPCSAFHDIPLYANEQQTILNMIVEIPRWTNAKLEVLLTNHLLLFEFNG